MVCLVLLFQFAGFSQVKADLQYAQIDSLYRIALQSEFPAGSQDLIETLNELGKTQSLEKFTVDSVLQFARKAFLNGNHPLALKLSNWVLHSQLFEILPHKKFEAYEIKIDVFAMEESVDSAAMALWGMESLMKIDGMKEKNPYFLFSKALVATMEQRYYEALTFLSELQFIIKNGPYHTLRMMANAEQGGVLIKLKRYKLALPYLKAAQESGEQLPLPHSIFSQVLSNNLGIAYMRIDSLEKAAKVFKGMLEKSQETGNPIENSKMHHNLANTRRQEGKFKAALMHNDSTIKICLKANIPVGVIFGRLGKTETLVKMGKAKQAAIELDKAKELLLQFPIPDLENEWNRLAAMTYNSLGRHEDAYTYLQEVLENGQIERENQINQLIQAWEVQLKNNQSERRALDSEIQLAAKQSMVRQLFFIAALLIVVVISGILYIIKRRQREEILTQLVEKEKENTKLQLDIKNRELASKSLDIQKALGIRDVMLKKLKKLNAQDLEEMNEKIEVLIGEIQNTLPEGLWEDFKKRFENVEQDFIPKLLEVCPDLSPIELKTATFLRLNLTSKEIASLTNRATGTVNNNRSALRKKLSIDNDENLMTFLLGL